MWGEIKSFAQYIGANFGEIFPGKNFPISLMHMQLVVVKTNKGQKKIKEGGGVCITVCTCCLDLTYYSHYSVQKTGRRLVIT